MTISFHYSFAQVEARYSKKEGLKEIPSELKAPSVSLAKFIFENRDSCPSISEAKSLLRKEIQIKRGFEETEALEGKIYALSLRVVAALLSKKSWATLPERIKQTKAEDTVKEKLAPYVRLLGFLSKAQSLKNQLNEQFAKYLIIEPLAEGSFNQVFYGYDILKAVPRAFRIMKDPEKKSFNEIDRWQSEVKLQAHLVSKLNLKNILEIDAIIFFNGSNQKICATVHPLYKATLYGCEKTNLLKTTIKMLETLGDLHRHQFMHGDIKPGNILYDKECQEIRLCDFGSALSYDQLEDGKYGGTIDYEMPESFYLNSASLSRWAGAIDMAALGITLYEVKYGQLPDHNELIEKMLIPHRVASIGTKENCLKYMKEHFCDIYLKYIQQANIKIEDIMDEILTSVIRPSYEVLFNPILQFLNQTQDPIDAVIAKMLIVDPDKRIKFKEALEELRKT